jgi:hypothetical protein
MPVVARPVEAGRTAARTLCNLSLRTASGPEGSSAKQILTCAAGSPGRGRVRLDDYGLRIDDCGLMRLTIEIAECGLSDPTIGNWPIGSQPNRQSPIPIANWQSDKSAVINRQSAFDRV